MALPLSLGAIVVLYVWKSTLDELAAVALSAAAALNAFASPRWFR